MRIRITNDFHNTEVRLRAEGELPYTLSASQAAQVRRTLCGQPGCTCGVIRGRQAFAVELTADSQGRETWLVSAR